jgi:hypothetical protein
VTLVTDLQVKAFIYIRILEVFVCSLRALATEESCSYCFNQRSQFAPFCFSKYVIGTIAEVGHFLNLTCRITVK